MKGSDLYGNYTSTTMLRGFVESRDFEVTHEDLNDIVEEAVALSFISSRNDGVRLLVNLAPMALPVTVDRIQVQQVLLNLIRNGVEATVGLAKRQITLSTGREDCAYGFVCVRDTGTGIASVALADLFQPFVTTKKKGWGWACPFASPSCCPTRATSWRRTRRPAAPASRFDFP
jgi:two-component system sensor kinase FixL